MLPSVLDSLSSEMVAANAGGQTARLLSLDVFRGLTIVGMILVNNPGSWSHVYWPLEHADWHGWTPTDLIFPFFLFIVGTSLSYSLRKYRSGRRIDPMVYWRIGRRSLLLILLSWLPEFLLRLINVISGTAETFNLSTLRLTGVLARIALVYCAASLIALHVPIRRQIILAAALLLGYWALLALLPNPHDYQANLSRDGNIVRVVDRALIGDSHLYTQGRQEPTDPEGLLSTLPAIVTSLLGYWAGLLIQWQGARERTVNLLIIAGGTCVAVGLAWSLVLPINKKLWTSSFVMLSGGLATIVLGGCLLIFDVWSRRRVARPLEIVGINAIFAYVASELAAVALDQIQMGGATMKERLYDTLFTSWISNPNMASLAFALTTIAFWWLVLWGMARCGWLIRV
jgi:predicted acyltransferase